MKKPSAAEQKKADISALVEKALNRGELRGAALIVKENGTSEKVFDDLMDGRPDLRRVYLSL